MTAVFYDHRAGLWDTGAAAAGRTSGGPEPAAPAAADLGLSKAHKWPLGPERQVGNFVVRSARGGSWCEIRQIGESRLGSGGGGCRRQVKGFSRASRLNCISTINKIDRRQVGQVWFLTLTVPRGEADWKEIERHRRAWFKRLRREYRGRWFSVWKKEAHKSGTPHLHALLFWLEAPPDLGAFKAWNDDAWADVVKSDNPHHRRVGCRVEVMRGWNGVAAYTAKYLTKDQEGLLGETGRIWGVERREEMPRDLAEEEVAQDEGNRVKRCLRKHQQRKRTTWHVWDDSAGRWYRIRPSKQAGTVDEQVRRYQQIGVRVKRKRPRLTYTVSVPLWYEEIEVRSGRETRRMVQDGEQLHSYTPAMHFVDADTVARLVEFFRRRCSSDRRLVESLPF